MTIATQGTQLYYLDPVGPTVTEVACTLSLDGFELTNNQTPTTCLALSLIHISEPTRRHHVSRMPSSA